MGIYMEYDKNKKGKMTLGFSLQLQLYSRSNQVPRNDLSISNATKAVASDFVSFFVTPFFLFLPSVNEDGDGVIEVQIDPLCQVQQQFVDTEHPREKDLQGSEEETRRKGQGAVGGVQEKELKAGGKR